MSITLDLLSTFLGAVKTSVYKVLDSGLIESYSLISQENENQLTITSYIKNGGWLKRFIPSSQTIVGVVYLVSNSSLSDLVARFKDSKRGCYIYQNDNGLSFATFNGYLEDGKVPNIYDSLLIKQYHGNVSEFGPAVFAKDIKVKIADEKLSIILNRLKNYGDYSTNSRPVLIVGDKEKQNITFYANQAEGRNFICRIVTDCYIKEDFSVYIEGQDINSLLCIFESKTDLETETTISIEESEQILTITNAFGAVTISLLDKEKNLSCSNWPMFFEYSKEEIHGYRIVELARLKEALVAQQPNKTYNNKLLKLSCEHLSMSVTKVGDTASVDYSLIDVVEVPSSTNKWQDLAYNAAALKKAVEIISKGKEIEENKTGKVAVTIVRKETKVKSKKIERWLAVFFSQGLEDAGIFTTVSTIANLVNGVEV